MPRKPPYPTHGPRRRWLRPFTVICRCGLDAHPCVVARSFAGQGLDPNALRAPLARADRDGEWRGFQW